MRKNTFSNVIMMALLGLGSSMGLAAEPIARVIEIQHTVLVNTGKDYTGVRLGQALEQGHRVLTLEESSAVVEYRNGCKLELGPNSLLTIEDDAQCQQGAAAAVGGTGAGSALSGGGRVGAGTEGVALAAASPEQRATLGGIPLGLIGAGGAMAVTITAAVISDDNNKERPLSPD